MSSRTVRCVHRQADAMSIVVCAMISCLSRFRKTAGTQQYPRRARAWGLALSIRSCSASCEAASVQAGAQEIYERALRYRYNPKSTRSPAERWASPSAPKNVPGRLGGVVSYPFAFSGEIRANFKVALPLPHGRMRDHGTGCVNSFRINNNWLEMRGQSGHRLCRHPLQHRSLIMADFDDCDTHGTP